MEESARYQRFMQNFTMYINTTQDSTQKTIEAVSEGIFAKTMLDLARSAVAKHLGLVAEQDGTLLSHETVQLVEEIEQFNKIWLTTLIDRALDERDEDLFIQLTNRSNLYWSRF